MSSFVLKILGIILMSIDHVGLMFFPAEYTFRALGRIAFPIFAFQTTQGFKYSKNKESDRKFGQNVAGKELFSSS